MVKIRKLCVFDFDKTLVRSPELEDVKLIYKEKTGNEWPYVGCWSKPESLDMEIFDIPLITDTALDYARVIGEECTMTVLLTGRLKRLENEVKKVLKAHHLVFDEYHFCNGGSTLEFKLNTLTKLLEKHPNIKEVEQWEDRLDHIPYFEQWGKMHCSKDELESYQINAVINV